MTTSLKILLLAIGVTILTGCQNLAQSTGGCETIAPCTPGDNNENNAIDDNEPDYIQNDTGINTQNTVAIVKKEPVIITATGYAAPVTNKRLSKSQARILTLRSSMLDAYRNLTERVYGLKIDGSSTVSNMVLQNDELRTYVDAYLVGAKVISQREHEDGTFETVVEMALQENFRQCVSSSQDGTTDSSCQESPSHQIINVESSRPTTNFYSID